MCCQAHEMTLIVRRISIVYYINDFVAQYTWQIEQILEARKRSVRLIIVVMLSPCKWVAVYLKQWSYQPMSTDKAIMTNYISTALSSMARGELATTAQRTIIMANNNKRKIIETRLFLARLFCQSNQKCKLCSIATDICCDVEMTCNKLNKLKDTHTPTYSNRSERRSERKSARVCVTMKFFVENFSTLLKTLHLFVC